MRLLLLIHALCLDVVAIALLWQNWVGQLLHLDLNLASMFVLGTSVWLVYVGDHLIDIYQNKQRMSQYRYMLLLNHWRFFVIFYVVVFIISFLVAYLGLSQKQFLSGFLLFLVCLFYMIFCARSRFIGKEALVALIFWAGIQIFYDIPAIFQDVHYNVFSLSLLLLLYLNASLSAYWEMAEDQKRGVSSIATQWPKGQKIMLLLAFVLFSFCLTASSLYPISLSLFLLITLHFLKNHFYSQNIRVLGDLTLLTPLLFYN